MDGVQPSSHRPLDRVQQEAAQAADLGQWEAGGQRIHHGGYQQLFTQTDHALLLTRHRRCVYSDFTPPPPFISQITAQELSDNRIISLTFSGRKLDKKVGSSPSSARAGALSVLLG